MTFLLKTYSVSVNGFPAYNYEGANPAQARAAAWRAYSSFQHVPFREFLRISSIRRADDPQGFGRPITVGGAPAYWVGYNGQYVRFCRPDKTVVLLSHPNDVAEVGHG
jgi:hypothetical protein